MIQTAETGGNYVLGFRIDPPETLTEVYQELMSLFSIYCEAPIFGVFYEPKQTVKLFIDLFELFLKNINFDFFFVGILIEFSVIN